MVMMVMGREYGNSKCNDQAKATIQRTRKKRARAHVCCTRCRCKCQNGNGNGNKDGRCASSVEKRAKSKSHITPTDPDQNPPHLAPQIHNDNPTFLLLTPSQHPQNPPKDSQRKRRRIHKRRHHPRHWWIFHDVGRVFLVSGQVSADGGSEGGFFFRGMERGRGRRLGLELTFDFSVVCVSAVCICAIFNVVCSPLAVLGVLMGSGTGIDVGISIGFFEDSLEGRQGAERARRGGDGGCTLVWSDVCG